MSLSPGFSYKVKIDPLKLELNVEIQIQGESATGDVRLEIPTWVPGDYFFKPYARDIFELRAQSTETNDSLLLRREGNNAFVVEGGLGAITINYKAYAYEIEFGEATGILDSQYAVLLGARYLHSPQYLGTCTVEYIDLPPTWLVHHPSGAKRHSDSNCWTYPSFEILLDTPVVFGQFDLLHRNIHGTEFYFAFVDRCLGFEDGVDTLVDQLVVVAEKAHAIFGEFPFEDYTFVLSFNPTADWGLEHLSSTMCGLGPDVFVNNDKFANAIRVCAHELFHAWNVRRLRPAPLDQLEYHLSDGAFTEGLWMAEGFTRYYEFLLSTRAKAYTANQFFSALVGYYEHLTVQPAYKRVTAIDSSLATYLNHSKYAGRINNSIDYYDKGMLIAFAVDISLRLQSSANSLDHVFAGFYQEFVADGANYAGYTTADIIKYFDAASSGLGATIGNSVIAPKGLDTPSHLAALGFEVINETKHYLGIVFLDSGSPEIYNVIDDSPAGGSGIAPGDVLTQINGYQYSLCALDSLSCAGQKLTLGIQRGHRNLSFEVTPGQRTKIRHLIWKGSDNQIEIISSWLDGQSFEPKQDEVIPLDFYENFHGIESLV